MSSFTKYYCINVGRKIKQYRIMSGYTQEQLSEKLGMNLKYIGHIERFERTISTKNLIKLLEIFKIQPHDFFKFDEKYRW